MDLREIGLGVWIGFDWLRTGTGGGLLWVRLVWWWWFCQWGETAPLNFSHPQACCSYPRSYTPGDWCRPM
jgi:hypothetical protein